MAPLSNHVSLTITQDSVGVRRAGFGKALLLSHNASWAERVRTYASLLEVAADFPSTTGPEYLAAAAYFAQSVKPEELKIGRGALKPTQVYTCSIAAVRNSHTYQMLVEGDGVTTTTVEYTSDASATDGEIVTGLVAALNAVTGNNYLAAGATSPFTITGDAAGEWFSIGVDCNDITLHQSHADPGVATDLAAIDLEDSDWYCLLTNYNSNAYVVAADGYIASSKKIYVVDSANTLCATAAVGGAGNDTMDNIATLARARTMVAYHPVPARMMSASWAGRCLPLDPGSETWKFKTLSGVTSVALTSTQRTNIRNKNGNSYETVAGLNITFEGTTADGDFLDVQRGIDWLEDDMAKGVFEALAGADKIPYTNAGVAVLEGKVRATLIRAVARGVLSDDPSPVVQVPKVADVSAADRAARNLPDIRWSGTLAGAIHKSDITGVVSV